MLNVQIISDFLESFAPARLAEEWDNVGLLVGDPSWHVRQVMTCLTVTPQTVDEAIANEANLIVTHHPLPFHPLKRITPATVVGRSLLQLVQHRIAVYSPHTAFDSTQKGINQQLAEGLELDHIKPLVPVENDPLQLGSGRWGRLATAKTLQTVGHRLKHFLGIAGLHLVGESEMSIQTIAVACGSAGQFLEPARQLGCDALVTGETSFHTALEAVATGVALLLPGHYASERFALDVLARVIAAEFPDINVWASRREQDPYMWLD